MTAALDGKTILITGGSSRLGECFVRRACAAGARVFFTYFSHTESLDELKALGAAGVRLDLADTAAIDAFARAFREEQKGLDCLIHNACAVRDKLLTDLTEEDFDYVLRVGLKAPFYLTKKMLPLLFKRRPSRVFMITSRVGEMGGFGVANYAAAKAGLTGLVKSLAREVGRKQVLVNAVNPGFMKSRMTGAIPEKYIQKNLDANPLGTWSDPDEVARFLVYLCSDEMSQVTGQTFNFEGRAIY